MAGTSVGALNAALFAVLPYERAEYVWTRLVPGRVLLPQDSAARALSEAVSGIADGSAAAVLLSAGRLLSGGVWSREGLLEIMRRVPLERLHDGGFPVVYAVCHALMSVAGTRHFRLNGLDEPSVRRVLLATSAIPLAFRPERIGSTLYCDGGVSCNVPIFPLEKERCTHALVVHLSQTDRICGGIPPRMRVAELRPSVRLGRMGVLDFSCGRIGSLIHLGYGDCKWAFSGKFRGFLP